MGHYKGAKSGTLFREGLLRGGGSRYRRGYVSDFKKRGGVVSKINV